PNLGLRLGRDLGRILVCARLRPAAPPCGGWGHEASRDASLPRLDPLPGDPLRGGAHRSVREPVLGSLVVAPVLARQRDAYLAHIEVERGITPTTTAVYKRTLNRYIAFLEGRGISSVANITRDDVAAFAEALSTGGDGGPQLAPSSASRAVVAVRG